MLEKAGEKGRKKACAFLTAASVALLILLLFILMPKLNKNAVSRNDRIAFISALGWQADAESESYRTVKIPDCGGRVMADYNEIIRKGGYDLSPYVGRTVDQYSYRLTNYPDTDKTVTITLYVWKGRVIGGDIHTSSVDGFLHELRENQP